MTWCYMTRCDAMQERNGFARKKEREPGEEPSPCLFRIFAFVFSSPFMFLAYSFFCPFPPCPSYLSEQYPFVFSLLFSRFPPSSFLFSLLLLFSFSSLLLSLSASPLACLCMHTPSAPMESTRGGEGRSGKERGEERRRAKLSCYDMPCHAMTVISSSSSSSFTSRNVHFTPLLQTLSFELPSGLVWSGLVWSGLASELVIPTGQTTSQSINQTINQSTG